jgi:hypothetical protein
MIGVLEPVVCCCSPGKQNTNSTARPVFFRLQRSGWLDSEKDSRCRGGEKVVAEETRTCEGQGRWQRRCLKLGLGVGGGWTGFIGSGCRGGQGGDRGPAVGWRLSKWFMTLPQNYYKSSPQRFIIEETKALNTRVG